MQQVNSLLQLEARVVATGAMHGAINNTRFEYAQHDPVNTTWRFSSDAGPEVLVREGDISLVTVNGRPQENDIIPHPWGLIMALQSADAFTVSSLSSSLSRTRLPDHSEILEFTTTSSAHIQLIVRPHGFVTNLVISVDGVGAESVRLVDVLYSSRGAAMRAI